jgi:selenocysteine lyase/cysteine desulfurase
VTETSLGHNSNSNFERHSNILQYYLCVDDLQVPRLAILSFLIRPFATSTSQWNGKSLNGRFVVNLLNDLFGIQARGGCSCAGPYGHALMKVRLGYQNSISAPMGALKKLRAHRLSPCAMLFLVSDEMEVDMLKA